MPINKILSYCFCLNAVVVVAFFFNFHKQFSCEASLFPDGTYCHLIFSYLLLVYRFELGLHLRDSEHYITMQQACTKLSRSHNRKLFDRSKNTRHNTQPNYDNKVSQCETRCRNVTRINSVSAKYKSTSLNRHEIKKTETGHKNTVDLRLCVPRGRRELRHTPSRDGCC